MAAAFAVPSGFAAERDGFPAGARAGAASDLARDFGGDEAPLVGAFFVAGALASAAGCAFAPRPRGAAADFAGATAFAAVVVLSWLPAGLAGVVFFGEGAFALAVAFAGVEVVVRAGRFEADGLAGGFVAIEVPWRGC